MSSKGRAQPEENWRQGGLTSVPSLRKFKITERYTGKIAQKKTGEAGGECDRTWCYYEVLHRV